MWSKPIKRRLERDTSYSGHSLRKAKSLFLITLFCLFNSLWSWAQQPSLWAASSSSLDKETIGVNYQRLNTERFSSLLKEVEQSGKARIQIPNPEGTLIEFDIKKSHLMAPALQEKFPNIRTYTSINARGETFKLVSTIKGIHGVAFTREGEFRITLEDSQTNTYKSYYTGLSESHELGADYSLEENHLKNNQVANQKNRDRFTRFTFGENLRKYRIALSAHATFTASAGGVEQALGILVTILNATTAVYERELGITFELVADNDKLITTVSNPGPFQSTGSAASNTLANQNFIDEVIGDENYDVGHFFGSAGGGGVASVEVVCKKGTKAHAGSSTLLRSDRIDNFIDLFLHELGHQFGATHTFTSADVCSLGSTAFTLRSAYEISSGSTIMSYAGLCSPSVTGTSDHYFHTFSSQQILKYINREDIFKCAVEVPTANIPPQVTVPESNFSIPINTPFVLSAIGSDANGDDLTYCWEQFDKAPEAENPPGAAYSNPLTGKDVVYFSKEAFLASDDYLTDEQIREGMPDRLPPGLPEAQLNAIIEATIIQRDQYLASIFRGDGPLFRSFPPSSQGKRYFPQLSQIVEGNTAIKDAQFEILPFLDRELNFVVSVRDNNPDGGGKTSDIVTFNATKAAGPFVVTTAFSEPVYNGLSNVEVTWDVAGTNQAPVNCQNVSILFSSDGGASFDAVLVERTPNDGSAILKLPNIATNGARIMVKAADNVFLNVNDRNFTIEASTVDVPEDPTDLIANRLNQNTIELSWSHAGDVENGFIVERSIGNTSSFEEIGRTAINETAFTDDSPAVDESNSYRIAAFNETGNSAYTNIATVEVAQSNETNIITFSFAEQTSAAVINTTDHTVSVEVAAGTDIASLVPTFTLSAGATTDVASEVARDFTNPVTYVITAEDGSTTQDWVVTVSVRSEALSDETDIITFSFAEQTSTALIDAADHTVSVEVPSDTDVTSLAPSFALSTGATSDVASGIARDFSSPVTYVITAEDGSTTQDWVVTVSVRSEALSDETDIITFSFAEQTSTALIDAADHTVSVEVPSDTDVTSLAPSFALSTGATSDVASGIARDFSSPVTYVITAEDGSTTQDWFVTINTGTVLSASDEEKWTIYPNPTDDILIVRSEKVIRVGLSDLHGRIVLPLRAGKDFTLDLSGLNPGMYFLILQNGEEQNFQKIIKN